MSGHTAAGPVINKTSMSAMPEISFIVPRSLTDFVNDSLISWKTE